MLDVLDDYLALLMILIQHHHHIWPYTIIVRSSECYFHGFLCHFCVILVVKFVSIWLLISCCQWIYTILLIQTFNIFIEHLSFSSRKGADSGFPSRYGIALLLFWLQLWYYKIYIIKLRAFSISNVFEFWWLTFSIVEILFFQKITMSLFFLFFVSAEILAVRGCSFFLVYL